MAKIAIIKRSLSPFGGLEKYTRRLSEYFLTTGHEVTFITSSSENLDPTYQYSFADDHSFFPHQKLNKFNRNSLLAANKNHYDCIFSMDRTSFHTHIRAGNGCHRAFLEMRKKQEPTWKKTSFLINPLHRSILNVEKQAFESSITKCIFVNSVMVKKEIQNYYNVPNEKIEVVHNGVEFHEIQSYFDAHDQIKSEIMTRLKIPSSRQYFLFIGNDYKRKGLVQALQALALYPADWELIVIGKDKNQKYFYEFAKSLGIARHVHFMGYQKETSKFYQLADVVLIPSLYDPFANVTVEALAHGCKIITSKTNGGSEIITPINGVVIEDLFDPDSFSEAIKQVFKTPFDRFSIRNSVHHLTFENQLKKIANSCLKE